MKVIVRDEAAQDLEAIFTWIAKDSPASAVKVLRTIRRRIDLLLTPGMARLGRLGADAGTLELVEPPYVIVYEVHDDRGEIVILSVVHGARDR
ncbi:MAG: type II toxin-antitoxin system RelE/ParE family toxin [Bauldia sp.]